MPTPDPVTEDVLRSGLIVRFEGVWAGYEGPDVLQDVDFEVAAGEVAIVSGPTAAGKTTLLHTLRLALPPRAGSALVLGEDIAQLTEARRARLKRRVGYVAEEPVFAEDHDVAYNVALPLRLARRKAADYAHDVHELLEFVGLSESAGEIVKRLSFAERRRVAIARALASKPDLILVDEPAAGLGPEAAHRTFRLLAEMRRIGAAVVIATQSEHLADGLEATHWRIAEGRVEQDGATYVGAEHYS
ncbi:MAG: ATP-binding cassette domain-containing protein [Hyphomonadaceae bacterium]|nr:ATP-binding cassette domain-containing protein [Hyphomonadaceae bacterium]